MGIIIEDPESYSPGTDLLAGGQWSQIAAGSKGFSVVNDLIYGKVFKLTHISGNGANYVYPSALTAHKNMQIRGSFLVPSSSPTTLTNVNLGARSIPTQPLSQSYHIRSDLSRAQYDSGLTLLENLEEVELQKNHWYAFLVSAFEDFITFSIDGNNPSSFINSDRTAAGLAGIGAGGTSGVYAYFGPIAISWDEFIGEKDEENPQTTCFEGVPSDAEYQYTITRAGECGEQTGNIWVFSDIDPGDYVVTVERDGCETQIVPITVE